MSTSGTRTPQLILGAVAGLALIAIAVPSASAAPATDDQGFLNSTARCSAPDVAVAFGNTETSRVAICKSPDGDYEYRGVRMRDGARLIVPATQSDHGEFNADSDGITYTVSADSLIVSMGTKVIRDEPMVSFHGPQGSRAPAAPQTPTPTTPLPPPLPAEVGGDS